MAVWGPAVAEELRRDVRLRAHVQGRQESATANRHRARKATPDYIGPTCGRFTYRLTWPELVRLYRLTLDTPARNIQPRYNICATTNIDTVIERDGRAASLSLPETSRRGRDVMAITKMRFCEASHRGLARSRSMGANPLPVMAAPAVIKENPAKAGLSLGRNRRAWQPHMRYRSTSITILSGSSPAAM